MQTTRVGFTVPSTVNAYYIDFHFFGYIVGIESVEVNTSAKNVRAHTTRTQYMSDTQHTLHYTKDTQTH